MDPLTQAALTIGFRVLLGVGVVLAVMFGLGKFERLVQAPVQAQLEASRGNQAAAKASVGKQNAAVDELRAKGEASQAKSAAAVKTAGEPSYEHARAIAAAPAEGATDYERAMNRIDRELGLK
jgi:hypothetical protein